MLVCKYKFNSALYANLIPTFNSGYTGYTVTDEDVDGTNLLEGVEFEEGIIREDNGENINAPEGQIRYRTIGYIKVQPNCSYVSNLGINARWYDGNKKFLGYTEYSTTHTSPANAWYLRFYIGNDLDNLTYLKFAEVTRTIECDTLPTLMVFGDTNDMPTNKELSLLEVLEMNTSNLTDCSRMFKCCENLTNINTEDWTLDKVTDIRMMFYKCSSLTQLDASNFNTSEITDMYYMFYGCNKLTQLDISNWNTSKVTNMYNMFYGCSSLTSLDVSNFDTSNVTHMTNMFRSCSNLTQVDVGNFDTSKVTSMYCMFHSCANLIQLDVSKWDTSNVTSMYNMFYDCKNLTQVDVSNWDTSKVENMNSMFQGCNNLTYLDVSNWDTSNVTDMYSMFHSCSNLTQLDLSNFDTSNVTNMNAMFNNCNKLTQLDVSNFDTSNVNNMRSMFNSCNNLTQLDVSNFDTSKVTTMYGMFNWCTNLTQLDLSNFDTSNVTDMSYMFNGCTNLVSLDMSNFDTTNVTAMDNVFNNPSNLEYIKCNNTTTINKISTYLLTRASKTQGIILCKQEDLSLIDMNTLSSKNWIVTNEFTKVAEYVYDKSIYNYLVSEFNEGYNGYFCEDIIEDNIVTRTIESIQGLPTLMRFGLTEGVATAKELSLLKILDMNTSKLTSCSNIFRLCSNLTSINCNFNTSKVTNMFCMFYGCSSLTQLDLSNFDTSNVTSMYAMFYGCTNLTSLDVSKWNTSKVNTMYCMFYGCQNLTSLDVSNFDTSNVTNMYGIFNGCGNLTSLDLSNFNTNNVTNMGYMFRSCSKLSSLDLSNWNTSKVTNMEYMFEGCSNLTSLDLSNWSILDDGNIIRMLTNTPENMNIAMLYCSWNTVNKINVYMASSRKIIWVKDTEAISYQQTGACVIKDYKEISDVINLTSPLLQGDKIVIKDGKLCHFHKMGMMVLDGSEDWIYDKDQIGIGENLVRFNLSENNIKLGNSMLYCDKLIFKYIHGNTAGQNRKYECISTHSTNSMINIIISKSKLSTADVNGFKQWLSENPIAVVYELKEPYYEDIIPIQSQWVIETLEESNMEILTNLPIKMNMSYITNIPSLSTLSTRVRKVKESDNLILNLTNMLDDEINQ